MEWLAKLNPFDKQRREEEEQQRAKREPCCTVLYCSVLYMHAAVGVCT